jgi:predicted small lipoprotein YifL
MRTHTLRQLITTCFVFSALTFALAACGSKGDPTPLPAPTSKTSSSSPSPTTPAWESKYTAEQIQAYNEALARWESYEQRSEPIWAKGKVTPAAEALFKEYWITWPNTLNTLRYLEANGVTKSGVPTVVSSQPKKVEEGSKDVTVVIRQCIDDSNVKTVSEAGAPSSTGPATPYVRLITMKKVSSTPWRIVGADGDKAQTCET